MGVCGQPPKFFQSTVDDLTKYARRIFWLGQKVDGGKITNRTNLERVAQATGRDLDALLAIPDCPKEIQYLFGWFTELRTGGEALTYREVQAWAELTGRSPTPDEVAALFTLDRLLEQSHKIDDK